MKEVPLHDGELGERLRKTAPIPGDGYAVFATRAVPEGEIIMEFQGAPHTLVTRDWIERDWSDRERGWFQTYAWPLTDQVWVTWPEDPEEWRPINHSCDPNAWLEELDLVARRDIRPGEEIRVDYATYGNNILTPFDCSCGATDCRGQVREDDHLLSLLDRYGDHISDYVMGKRESARE
jgi:hypothetical protein